MNNDALNLNVKGLMNKGQISFYIDRYIVLEILSFHLQKDQISPQCPDSQGHRLHVVGGQHPRLAGPVHRPRHPSLVNEGGVDDDVPVPEAHLVRVLALIVVHGPIAASPLGDPAAGMTRSRCTLLTGAGVGDSAL